MTENSKKPRIRFKGFTDAWEQRKLGKLVHFSKGAGYSKGDLKESGTPIILYGRLYTKYETIISDVDTFAEAKEGSVYSRGGEVIVPASGETAEDISIASVVEKSGVLLGGDLNIITPQNNLDSAFLAISISSGKPHNDMAKMAQGKSVVHLHNGDLEKIMLVYPSNDEQVHISTYFKNFDNLITLHQCKYKNEGNKKCQPQQKIITQKTSITWEQRKLGDVGKARSGIGFPDSEQGGTVGTPFFKVSDMNTEGNEKEMTVANNYVTDDQIVSRKWSPIEELPAIFFAKVGAAVMLNRKRLCRVPFLLDNNTMAYSLSKDWWDANFAKALFETVDLTSLVQVGALPSYNAGDVEGMGVLLPKLLEQEKIGAYFKNLDDLITLHQCKDGSAFRVKTQRNLPQKNAFKSITWEQRKLGEVASKVTEKNVQNTVTETFTNSAEFGIISQRDFFDHDIAKVDKIDGYYVVQNDDFVYNPRISVTAPCGPINRNKMGRNGVMSPLYTVFRVQGISKLYLEWYFKTSNWHSYMYFNGDSGARSDRFSIKNELFFEMPLPTPCHKEQERIGELLDDLENLITLHQRGGYYYKRSLLWLKQQKKRNYFVTILNAGSECTKTVQFVRLL